MVHKQHLQDSPFRVLCIQVLISVYVTGQNESGLIVEPSYVLHSNYQTSKLKHWGRVSTQQPTCHHDPTPALQNPLIVPKFGCATSTQPRLKHR